MARIILHNNSTNEAVNEMRLLEDFKLSHEKRMIKAFQLMKLSLMFSNKNKTTFKKGIILKAR
jgi:hypothetical protein